MQLPLDDLKPTVPVLVAVPLDGVFDYTVPDDMTLAPGDIVEVPFAGRLVLGCVWSEMRPAGDSASFKLKAVHQKFEATPLQAPMRQLVEKVAERTLAPRGACLKLVLNVPTALAPEPVKTGYRRCSDIPETLKITAARRKVLDATHVDGEIRSLSDFAEQSGVSQAVVKGLATAGVFESCDMPAPVMPGPMLDKSIAPALDAQQTHAYQTIRAHLDQNATATSLLAGVTGSGKTFVYAKLVEDVLRQGKQVLVLLPEIGLTAQLVERLTTRFGGPPALWHSSQNPVLRRRIWRGVADGTVPLVTGARSALFLPFRNLGLIVIDEEHDQSYKQHDGVPYHGRSVALWRSELEHCPVVLSSATPSLEAAVGAGAFGLQSAKSETSALTSLHDRHGGARLPHIGLIDLKADRPSRGQFLSQSLRRKIEDHLGRGEQVLLFLNRRGYAPLTVCRGCGHRMQCPNCATWLVHHQIRRRLQCHHCSYAMPLPDFCPSCGSIESMAGSGPGVERISEEAAKLFPDARQAIMTSDTIYRADQAMALNQAMQAGKVNLLIGTQLAAKGLHFPNLTLVGVVDGDLGIEGADPRAAERSFQLLWQVAGRAGRADKRGLVLIQTHFPGHPVMNALSQGDFEQFYRTLYDERLRASLPPCGALGAVIITGPDLAKARQFAETVVKASPEVDGIRVLGPAPAPIPLMRGRHRLRILLRAEADIDVPTVMGSWLSRIRVPSAIRMQVDPDPYSFF